MHSNWIANMVKLEHFYVSFIEPGLYLKIRVISVLVLYLLIVFQVLMFIFDGYN